MQRRPNRPQQGDFAAQPQLQQPPQQREISIGTAAFLAEAGLSPAALAEGHEDSGRWGVPLHAALLARGALTPAAYARLAGHCFSRPVLLDPAAAPTLHVEPGQAPAQPRMAGITSADDDAPGIAIETSAFAPEELHELMRSRSVVGRRVAFTTPGIIRRALLLRSQHELAAHSVNALAMALPHASARTGLWLMQKLGLAGVAIAALFVGFVAPWLALEAAMTLLTLAFATVVLLRIAILVHAIFSASVPRFQEPPVRLLPDCDLPIYTVLVPLFGEANMLPQLVAALSRLDYPLAKLDIKLILESIDRETIAAARATPLPPQFEIVIVPDCQPRTKPKALNFALQLARGAFVTVYDAEDVPEPGQLRRAATMFADAPEGLACVQAVLAIDNTRDGFLARQFAVEYCCLFRGILPALRAFGLPIPLGGTSNHFRTRQLIEIGAWDPYNVTEDADLGIRLARAGLACRMLASETYEEAPVRLGDWMKQRTRWMKGWMQTYIVHTRQPLRLLRELGPLGWLGFHAILGGVILSALMHPLAYLLIGHQLSGGHLLTELPGTIMQGWSLQASGEQLLLVVALGNLAAGYCAAILLALVSLLRHGPRRLLVASFLIPVYWLLISFAAYRALWQLFHAPFYWEKTGHGHSTRRSQPGTDKA